MAASVASSVAGVAEAAAGPLGSVGRPLASVAASVVDIADDATAPIRSAARPVVAQVDRQVAGARRRYQGTGPARAGRLRASAKRTLPSLYELHPEARRASIRELGVHEVPVEAIRGTAVEGPAQRGGDFLPLEGLRTSNWAARWQRIRKAVEGLTILPPIDVYKYGEEYWVVDGHNRVAAALYGDQVAVDAAVKELRVPGAVRASRTPTGSLLEEGRELRAAGTGRRSRTHIHTDELPGSIGDR